MAEHLRGTGGAPNNDGAQHGGPHRRVVIAVVVAVLAVAGIATALAVNLPREQAAAPSAPSETPAAGDATTDVAEPAGSDGQAPEGLPFSVDGVDAGAALTEVSEGTEKAALKDEWTFGGDYAKIGSFPVDASTVFGSVTDDPNDLAGYKAALIGRDGTAQPIEEGGASGSKTYEPQDGTARAGFAVWRSSVLSLVPASGTDDWRLQAWSEGTGTVVLGSADDLNGGSDTPVLDGEIVPTANDTFAFFASQKRGDSGWTPAVLAYDVDVEGGGATVLDEGSYPAATPEGAVWAAQGVSGSSTLFSTLRSWDGGRPADVFTVTSKTGSWGISGVWAQGSMRAVAFSSADGQGGCYLGIWKDGFKSCVAWLHVGATRAVASLNGDWLVWGGGSTGDNAGMYAYSLKDGRVAYLGSAPGYARPSIAADSDAVLVPETDGKSAVVFHVGTLE